MCAIPIVHMVESGREIVKDMDVFHICRLRGPPSTFCISRIHLSTIFRLARLSHTLCSKGALRASTSALRQAQGYSLE